MDLHRELNLAIKAAKEAGEYLSKVSKIEVISNTGKDIKLKVDEKAEEIILKYLSQTRYPIIAEETKIREKSSEDLEWIVDSLDGSLNFYRGIPNCAVSIALWNGLQPLLGVVYDFNRDEIYSGIVGEGAYINGERIFVSETKNKKDSIICSGIAKKADYSEENLLSIVKKLIEFKKVRFLGSATLSLAYVAAGRVDAYQENNILLWDVAAGLALVKAAAGEIDFKDLGENQFDVWASNGKIKRD